MKLKRKNAKRRAIRTRAKVQGTAKRPRLSVFRSSKHISVQLIDDAAGKTIVSSSDTAVDAKGKKGMEIATLVGEDIGKKAIASGAKEIVFDRGSYKYHGRIKALADAARETGLVF
jgi:large subunit ribosomal protein L18